MLFSRTYRYRTAKPIEEIKSCLLGQHVKVHKMDFEVYEKDRMIKIIPHAENIENLKTLPITHVEFIGKNEKETQVVVSSKMRKIDKGGPLIIVFFCFFMMLAAVVLATNGPDFSSYYLPLGGIALGVFIIFWVKMETGYFDYVRKIRDFVKKNCIA